MFTLEDLDLEELRIFYRALPMPEQHPTPEADARLHPNDYLIVGA